MSSQKPDELGADETGPDELEVTGTDMNKEARTT